MSPETTSGEYLPLKGVTIVSVCQVLTGPFATMILGDMGAEVLKVEAVGTGDLGRAISEDERFFEVINRNKKSICVNLKDPDGQNLVRRLSRDADMFVENMKPGRMKKFNLAYEDIHNVNPAILYCSINGFGSGSPYRDLPAIDHLIQAMSGIMGITGPEDGKPTWCGIPIGDLITASYVVPSLITALYAREQGLIESEFIEIPMLDAAISWLTTRAGYSFKTGQPWPRGRHAGLEPIGVYGTGDGNIFVAAGSEGIWPTLCEAMDRSDLAGDSRFKTAPERVENRHELRSILEEELSRKSTSEWLDIFHDHGVPVGPVYDSRTVWDDEHVKKRKLHQRMKRSNGEMSDFVANPVRFKNLDTAISSAPPLLAEHTHEILKEHGLSEEEIEKLTEAGTIQ